MKAICRYSGIEFQTQFFPYTFTNSTQHHPVFDIPASNLLSLADKYTDNAFNPIDARLYFLALLKATNLVHFRTYARPSDSIIAKNMEKVLRAVNWITAITQPELFDSLPRFVVSQDTAALEYIDGWVDTWDDARKEIADQYRIYNAAQALIQREAALERLIRNPNRTLESYARPLSEWAAIAADFPSAIISNPFHPDETISLRDYWKDIIIKCGQQGFAIWKIHKADLEELVEHLEYNLPHGNISSYSVMSLVRSGLQRYDSILGLNTFTAPSSKFKLLDDSDGIEKANIIAAAALAPDIEPIASDYPSKVAYLRAKSRWNLKKSLDAAQNHESQNTANTANNDTVVGGETI